MDGPIGASFNASLHASILHTSDACAYSCIDRPLYSSTGGWSDSPIPAQFNAGFILSLPVRMFLTLPSLLLSSVGSSAAFVASPIQTSLDCFTASSYRSFLRLIFRSNYRSFGASPSRSLMHSFDDPVVHSFTDLSGRTIIPVPACSFSTLTTLDCLLFSMPHCRCVSVCEPHHPSSFGDPLNARTYRCVTVSMGRCPTLPVDLSLMSRNAGYILGRCIHLSSVHCVYRSV